MAEIAKLVDALASGDDLSLRIRADSSIRTGFQQLHAILNRALETIGDGDSKLGLEVWDQSQIQAVASFALAVVNSTRSSSGTLRVF